MIVLLNISDSDKHFDTAIQEYIKRLWKKVKICNIKPVKHWGQKTIVAKETAIIKKHIDTYHNCYKILLSLDGENITTNTFVSLSETYNDILFIIGGPYGLDEKKIIIDKKISFGHMTMPHWLIKLVLLEQIYRSYCIKIGKTYHY